jgi:hypothetical protein
MSLSLSTRVGADDGVAVASRVVLLLSHLVRLQDPKIPSTTTTSRNQRGQPADRQLQIDEPVEFEKLNGRSIEGQDLIRRIAPSF